MRAAQEFAYCPCCAAPLTTITHEARTRLACSQRCGYVYWNNPVPVVAAVVLHEEAVVLVRQQSWPEGWMGLVTGFLEREEEPVTAIMREIREELGLEPETVEWIGEFAYPEQNQVILAYSVSCRGHVTLGAELSEFKKVAPDKLRSWPFGTGRAVKVWLDRRKA